MTFDAHAVAPAQDLAVVSKVFNMNSSEILVVYQQHISTNALGVDYFSLRAGIAVNE